LFSAILITSLDRVVSLNLSKVKLLNSECGYSCGFLIQKEHFLNPMDWILVKLSNYFPADYIIFFIIVSFVFISSFYGNIKAGTKIIFGKVRVIDTIQP
jgi:LMBR1 domain-containing protein 1